MKIKKTVLTFTVLHPAEDNVAEMSPEQIFEECDNGGFVGNWTYGSSVDVPDETVEGELQALGNDGEFFKTFGWGIPDGEGDEGDAETEEA